MTNTYWEPWSVGAIITIIDFPTEKLISLIQTVKQPEYQTATLTTAIEMLGNQQAPANWAHFKEFAKSDDEEVVIAAGLAACESFGLLTRQQEDPEKSPLTRLLSVRGMWPHRDFFIRFFADKNKSWKESVAVLQESRLPRHANAMKVAAKTFLDETPPDAVEDRIAQMRNSFYRDEHFFSGVGLIFFFAQAVEALAEAKSIENLDISLFKYLFENAKTFAAESSSNENGQEGF